jgi:uncharacterized protein (TIGR02246 family)
MRSKPSFASAALAVTLLACGAPPASVPDDTEASEAALREAVAAMLAAWEAEDAAAIDAFYADDVMQIPPGEDIIPDRATLMASVAAFDEQGDYSIEGRITDLHMSGSLAWTLIDYSDVMMPADGSEAVETTGRWAILWMRGDDGRWRISREIWNYPPAGGPGA